MISRVLVAVLCATMTVRAFEWSAGGRPEVTRQAIAGLWKLTPQPSYPLKEFTVHPKEEKTNNNQLAKRKKAQEDEELLLMLKEDGSFQQYMGQEIHDDDDDDEQQQQQGRDVNKAWNEFLRETMSSKQPTTDGSLSFLARELVKGVWDFRDGKLYLAADRPDENHLKKRQFLSDNLSQARKDQEQTNKDKQNKQHLHPLSSLSSSSSYLDKLIVGRVVATYGQSLQDNPILSSASISSPKNQEQQEPSLSTSNQSKFALDAYLSVTKASLKVGRFFYPKHHPSFFEQPIYNPHTTDRHFQLKQVLGSLNTARPKTPEKTLDPVFQRFHFYNKTFWLTSHPLQQPQKTRPAKRQRDDQPWSPKRKRFSESETINPLAESAHIRVMQVRFFPNNTFATVWGTGDAILRGKFDILSDGTQFWMQVSRFGFGRSVSGSVYSEGRMLSQEDAKTYWGTIRQLNGTSTPILHARGGDLYSQNNNNNNSIGMNGTGTGTNVTMIQQQRQESELASILEVEGSVLFGTGLEPLPVGRFLMREMLQQELDENALDDDDDDDDDDEDDDDDIDIDMDMSSLPRFFTLDDSDRSNADDSLDWMMGNDNAFQ